MVTIPTPEQVGGQVAGQVQDVAAQAGGGILNGIKNILMSPLNAIAGFGKGVLNFGTLTTGGIIAAALAGIHYLVPDVWGAGAQAIGGDKLRQEQAIGDKSLWDILKQHLTLGMGASVAMNGAKGAWNGVTETAAEAREEGSTLGGIASTIAGAAAFAGIAFVGIGAIKHMTGSDTVSPTGTPATGEKTPVKSA